MKRKITIEDIAKKSGVTTATVSLVINNHPRIPDTTKEKIKKIMQDLNYKPNTIARALARGKTDLIAIMSISFSAWYEMALLKGIEKKLMNTNFSMMQIPTYGNKTREKEIIKDLILSKKADGLISFSVIPDKETIELIKEKKFPFVIIGEKINGICSVYFDDYKGAYMASEYLIKKGRKNIAIINQKQVKGWTARDVKERLKGFIAACKENKIFDYKIIEVENVYFEDGVKSCIEIQKHKKINGVFCAAGDNVAIGFLKQAKKLNIKIPDDIALVGYDDIEIAQAVTPELTTIRQPVFDAGSQAFLLLKEQFNKKRPENKIFRPEIVIRESA